MKKNKYDLLSDVAWLIYKTDKCFSTDCPLYDKCQKYKGNDIACKDVAKAHETLIKKYNLER